MNKLVIGLVSSVMLYFIFQEFRRTDMTTILPDMNKTLTFCSSVGGDFHMIRKPSSWSDETEYGCKMSFWKPEEESKNEI